MPNIRVHIFIYGGVHGVFFRNNVEKLANLKGIKGFVRNVVEGKKDCVECVFEGEKSKVEKLAEYCRRGPEKARVDKIEVKKEKYKGEFKEFCVKY